MSRFTIKKAGPFEYFYNKIKETGIDTSGIDTFINELADENFSHVESKYLLRYEDNAKCRAVSYIVINTFNAQKYFFTVYLLLRYDT